MKLTILCIFTIVLVLVYLFRCKKNIKEKFADEIGENEILSKLDDNGKILYYIQKDLKHVLKHRKHGHLDFNLSEGLRKILNDINTIIKTGGKDKTEKEKKAVDDKEFIIILMNGIKTGNLEIIQEIFKADLKEPNQIKSKINNILQDTLYHSDKENFSNMLKINGININEFRDNYKKNMMDISNKLQKFKMQNKSNIEQFIDYDSPHKHTRLGQIDGLNDTDLNESNFSNETWLRNPNNMRLVQEYNFLSDGQKKGILNGMDKLEQELQGLKEYSASNYTTLNDKVRKIEAQVAKEDRIRQEDAKFADSPSYLEDKAFRDFNENEKAQEMKMKNINQKIADLEKEQKGLNLSQLDSIKSMKSLGDGQVLSVQNIKDNTYNIKANQGCLVSQKVNDNYVLDIGKCSNVKAQSFNINHIANDDEYNKYLKSNLPQDSGMVYPVNVITSSDNNKMCLNIMGNNIGLQECTDSNYARFESLKTEKDCDSKYGN
jgi:hypothetical protein